MDVIAYFGSGHEIISKLDHLRDEYHSFSQIPEYISGRRCLNV